MKNALMSTEEFMGLRRRVTLIVLAMAVVFLLLLSRLWYLQVLNGDYYEGVAQGNRIRVIPNEAPRGIIYDREGVILAFNRPAFNVQLVPEDTPDINGSLGNLSLLAGTPVQELEKSLRENRSGLRFKPVVLLKDIGRKTADLLDSYLDDLPGISVTVEPKRLYPTAFLSSHIIGYVGSINEEQLKLLPLSKLYSGRVVGQSGVERMLDELLVGTDGGRQVEVDNVGRELKMLTDPVKPVPGHDVYLSIDLRLQRYIRTLMAGKRGVVIVMKPRTGEILSMNSFPDFDPNLFVGGIEDQHWNKMLDGGRHPLINKAAQGVYPPGSTFKMVVALAGLDTGIITKDTTYECPGYMRLNREISYCWKRSGHGEVNVVEAISQSCNVFFYKLGLELGVERIRKYANLLGFGLPTGVELESEKPGLIPSKEWKRRVLKEKWYVGETIPVAIGQGFITVTPLQLANYTNVIANRGLWVRPTLVRNVVSPDGQKLLPESGQPRQTRLLDIPEEYFDIVREGMVEAVYGSGTAFRARSKSFTIAGKTGTSQVIGRGLKPIKKEDLDPKYLPHSLFVAFAPAENPQVSVAVLVENGDAGSLVAAPLGRKVLEYYHRHIEQFMAEPPEIKTTNKRKQRFRNRLRQAFKKQNPN